MPYLDLAALDREIIQRSEGAFEFLERLVAAPSVVGEESAAQEVVAAELESLGFEVTQLPIDDAIAEDPAAGVPQRSYAGRFNVLGHWSPSQGRSLLVNGHIDVVPPSQPELWRSDPFCPIRNDGWLFGRGAGDMKGGFAMATLAIAALANVAPAALTGQLSFLSAIEEECTGNGTLAAARAGVLADAIVLPEPTGLDLLLAGVGVMWFELTIQGRAAHAESADRAVNPIDAAIPIIAALRDLERGMNEGVRDKTFASVDHPYNVNVGTMRAGDWPSSVPALARLGVRVGYPTTWGPARAEARVRKAIERAVRLDPGLESAPPEIRCTGFRAEGYSLPEAHPLVAAIAAAHESAHGTRPNAIARGSTTDARLYINQFGLPALCYGPRARNIHGVDEAVELSSIVDGAKTLARFMATWFHMGVRAEVKA